MGDLVESFTKLDLSDVPALTGYDSDRSRILWLMWVGHAKAAIHLLSPGEISAVLRDGFKIHIPRQRVESILSDEKDTVARRSRNKRRVYQIMQSGINEIEAQSASVVFISPAQALSQFRKVEALLAQLEGDLRLCDPYVDGRTLDVLGNCTRAKAIKLLTANIKNENALKGDLKIFAKQHGNRLEVRKVSPGTLHDRYLIHDHGMLLIGTSLNGLGLKQSFVVELGEDIRAAIIPAFEGQWGTANSV